MALDPRLSLFAGQGVTPVRDPLATMGAVYQLQGQQQQNAAAALQLAEAQRQERERGTLAQAFRQNVVTDPTTGQRRLDVPGAFSTAYGMTTDPLTVFKAEQGYLKQQADVRKDQLAAQKDLLETRMKGLELVGNVANGVLAAIDGGADPQQAYQQGIATVAQALGPDMIRGLPPTFDRGTVTGFAAQSKQYYDKLKAEHEALSRGLREREIVQGQERIALDKQRFGLEERKTVVQEKAEERQAAEAPWTAEKRDLERQKLQLDLQKAHRDASGALSPSDQRKLSLDLRQNIRQEPSFKIFTQVRNGVQNVEVGAGRQDAAGDLAIVNGYAKILDPEGVVRPEEFKTVEAAQGFFERWLAIPGKIWEGDRLLPDVRARFLDAARQLGKEKQATAQQELSTVYKPLAQDAGLNFDQLLPLALEQPRGPGGTGQGTSSQGKTLSEADITTTMQRSGKTRQEVLDAARAQGYTVPEK